MESLYQSIPMELWPDEYLPDDYKGPSAGPIRVIVGKVFAFIRLIVQFHSSPLKRNLVHAYTGVIHHSSVQKDFQHQYLTGRENGRTLT
jgi:hypothetical protein